MRFLQTFLFIRTVPQMLHAKCQPHATDGGGNMINTECPQHTSSPVYFYFFFCFPVELRSTSSMLGGKKSRLYSGNNLKFIQYVSVCFCKHYCLYRQFHYSFFRVPLAGHFPSSTTCFLQRFSPEIIAKYFKALDMENIFLTLHHCIILDRGNEPSVSIIGLTHTIGQQANSFHQCIPGPAAFVQL